MLALKEKIHNLETILVQKDISPEVSQIVSKEIEKLKQELAKQKQ
jgi:SMC interacting uncharacterized protein involved in chromosome segregation